MKFQWSTGMLQCNNVTLYSWNVFKYSKIDKQCTIKLEATYSILLSHNSFFAISDVIFQKILSLVRFTESLGFTEIHILRLHVKFSYHSDTRYFQKWQTNRESNVTQNLNRSKCRDSLRTSKCSRSTTNISLFVDSAAPSNSRQGIKYSIRSDISESSAFAQPASRTVI